MARFLADEQFPARVTRRLRLLGHDVATVQDFNQSKYGDGKDDSLVLSIATTEKRALLTLNRKDFRALHHSGQHGGHAGIILCRQEDEAPDAQARRIDSIIKDHIREHHPWTANSSTFHVSVLENRDARAVMTNNNSRGARTARCSAPRQTDRSKI